MVRKKLIAGNWKMNGLLADCSAKINDLKSLLAKHKESSKVEVAICPPFTLINKMVDCANNSIIKVGAQDCHSQGHGAHTGDISAAMLNDLGCRYVILGHSERRKDHNESSQCIKNKVASAVSNNLVAIVCVGETKEDKEQGKTLTVVTKQLQESLMPNLNAGNLVIAYEPVWAIGTGLVPNLEDIENVHKSIREVLANLISSEEANKIRILYGGSLNAKNCNEILAIADVDGGLIGGASLVPQDFAKIVDSVK